MGDKYIYIYNNFFSLFKKIKKYSYILLFIRMDSVNIKELEDDIKVIEDDVSRINCTAILNLIIHTLKCIKDSIYYLFSCFIFKKD